MEIFVELKRLLNTLGLLGRRNSTGIFIDYVIRIFCLAVLLVLMVPAMLFAIFETKSFAQLTESIIILTGLLTSFVIYSVMLVQRMQILHLFDKIQKKINERELAFHIDSKSLICSALTFYRAG